MEKFGVSSEREYKERMMKEKKVMKHSAVGLNSWQAQEEGLEKIYDELTKSGSYIDRYGACLDWVMGVPEEHRSKIQPGSGLILKTRMNGRVSVRWCLSSLIWATTSSVH